MKAGGVFVIETPGGRCEPQASSARSQTVRPIDYRTCSIGLILPVRIRTCTELLARTYQKAGYAASVRG